MYCFNKFLQKARNKKSLLSMSHNVKLYERTGRNVLADDYPSLAFRRSHFGHQQHLWFLCGTRGYHFVSQHGIKCPLTYLRWQPLVVPSRSNTYHWMPKVTSAPWRVFLSQINVVMGLKQISCPPFVLEMFNTSFIYKIWMLSVPQSTESVVFLQYRESTIILDCYKAIHVQIRSEHRHYISKLAL